MLHTNSALVRGRLDRVVDTNAAGRDGERVHERQCQERRAKVSVDSHVKLNLK